MQINSTLKSALDAMTEGVLLIDTSGVIAFVNRAYEAFLQKELGSDLGVLTGRLLRDVRPGARLPEVLKSGQPILHAPRREVEDIYFVNMYPIYEEGVLTGGMSVVTFLRDAYDFRTELEAYERRSLQVLHRINKANSARYTFDSIIAGTPEAGAVKEMARKIAVTDATVLLESESGTGKELYAQAIHNASPRNHSVFVAINCANFNPNMLESELFGYVEGAFTGAKKGGKIGLFEAAAGGTLFLDEISEMDLGLQSKLLRVLQERRVRPVGGVNELEVDVRIVAACNANLLDYVKEGRFRKDLYYRLSAFPIHIPPLRQRREDIPALAHVMLEELSRKLKCSLTITQEALSALKTHDWPGNVRELGNVLEFSAYLSPTGSIGLDALPVELVHAQRSQSQLSLSQRTQVFQQREIKKLLEQNGTDLAGKKKTAAQLGISLASLYNKLSG